MRILMVCLGNICRSPIAEGVLRHKAKLHGLNWTVESAGTESYHIGEPPHRFSQKICLEHGIDISGCRATKLTAEHFAGYDKIYAFAEDVYREIKRIGGRTADIKKVTYFLSELHSSTGGNTQMLDPMPFDVPDPYYGQEEGYRQVYELIDKTCEAIVARYK
jgi:protein-tyrosine phosphatase